MTESAKQPVMLIVLDGWGHRDDPKHNGIAQAKKPFFDFLWKNYPHTLIDGSGPAVGLPVGIMGNSEVGHMNLGSGRIVDSGLSQIYRAIENKSFFANPALLSAFAQTKTAHSTLHLLGLVSDGAVHSHEDHLFALLNMAKQQGLSADQVLVHCFLDGRDTSPRDALRGLSRLKEKMADLGVGRIASVGGRYFAMDRDKNWTRTAQAFFAMQGQAEQVADAEDYVRACYQKNITDEFIPPVSVSSNDEKVAVKNDDAMIFFNFRADRARQLSHAFVDSDFTSFDRKKATHPKVFVCFAPYDETLDCPVAFVPRYPVNTLADVLAQNGYKQLRVAETEKYAHVTFFFNGGREKPVAHETRVLVPSAKDVPTYDLKPEMSAFAVRDELVQALQNQNYDFIVCNFANTDMVGHTAVMPAIVRAVETVDACLRDVVSLVLQKKGVVIITADHGNAEMTANEAGAPMTAHTTNLVPLILVSEQFKNCQLKTCGRLCDVAPTLLEIMGLAKPVEMTGLSLLVKQ